MVAACHVLMLDPWWNPSAVDQAVDRAHRIGQTRPVTVSRLTVKDAVEDRILSLQVILSLMHLHYGVQIFFPCLEGIDFNSVVIESIRSPAQQKNG